MLGLCGLEPAVLQVDFLKTMLESTDTGGSKSFLELGYDV